jgi:tetratricopeptide (TPR) repeat protein
MNRRQSRIFLQLWLIALLGCFTAAPAQDSAGQARRGQVDLLCKIKPQEGYHGFRVWQIELHRSSGEIVQRELKMSGDKVQFRNLNPGIYVLSIADGSGREHRESIDLTPPPGQMRYQFQREIDLPGLTPTHGTQQRVSARRLSVSPSAKKLLVKSEEARFRGDDKESLKQLNGALAIDPGYPDALNNIGVLYRRRGDLSAAMGFFRRSVESDPDYYPAWFNLGGCLLAFGRFDEALAANRRAQEQRPEDPVPNSQLALNYYYMRKYEEASEYFKKVARLDPSNAVSPQLFLAQIAIRNKNVEDAEIYVQEFLKFHPNSPHLAGLKHSLGALRAEGSGVLPFFDTETGP